MQRLLHKSSGGFLLWTCRMSNASLNSREKHLNQFNAKFSSPEAKGTIVWVFVVVFFSGDTTNTDMYLSGLQQPKRNLPEDLTELQHNGK